MHRNSSNERPARRWAPAIAMLLATGLLAGCKDRAPDPGLIQAPGFSDEAGGLARPWRFAHHASTDSYRLEVRDGSVSIERTGPEPWALLAQSIPAEMLDSLAGRRLAFSMDVRAELEDETFGPPLEPTALTVQMWVQPPSDRASPLHAMLGPRQAETARLALPSPGRIPEWERYTLEFTTPEDLSRMEASVMMTSGGRLELRNPSLHLLDQRDQ